MKTIYPDSRVEIWDAAYVNRPESRSYQDKTARIVQIEPGTHTNDYIVEVIDDARED